MRRRALNANLVALSSCLGLLSLASCTIGPWRITIPGRPTQKPAIVLRWCDQARDVLCVLGFGLEPPDQMVITLLAAPGLPLDLAAQARWDGETGSYVCEPTNAEGTLFACTGPLIPLGSTLQLEVTAVADKAIIASGSFVLNGLALPTIPSGAELPPTDAVTITPRSTRTPTSGTPYPNPTSRSLFGVHPTSTARPIFNVVPTASSKSIVNPSPTPSPNPSPRSP